MSTTMTVGQLKARLEGYDDEQVVMIAHQPAWPLAEALRNVIDDTERDVHDDEADELDEGQELSATVWLVAGGHAYNRHPHAPRDLFESI